MARSEGSGKCPFPRGATIVSYARDSGGDEQERSVDQQNAVYTAFCEEHGLVLLRTFGDRARPGGSTVGREDFDRMIDQLRHGPDDVAGLLAWKLNRFARNLNDSQFFKADLRRRGFVLHFIADDIPDAGDATPLFETLLEWKAQRDRHDISVDAKRGLADLVSTKKPDGTYEGFFPGNEPRCYKRELIQIGRKRNGQPRIVGRLVPDPELWATGQLAWALRAAGASLRQVHAQTHLYKHKGCYSTFFANAIYKGEMHFGGQVLTNFVPPLCTSEQFDAVQALRGDPQQHPRRVASRFFLSGILYCDQCGGLLAGTTSGPNRWRSYRCRNCVQTRISADAIETAMLELLSSRILTAQAVAKFYEHWKASAQANGTRGILPTIQRLRKELATTRRALSNLLDQLEEGELGGRAIIGRIQQHEEEQRQLEADIARLQSASAPMATPQALTEDKWGALADELHTVLLSADPEMLKPILRSHVVKVETQKRSGRVTFAFSRPMPELPVSVKVHQISPAAASKGHRGRPRAQWAAVTESFDEPHPRFSSAAALQHAQFEALWSLVEPVLRKILAAPRNTDPEE